MTRVIALALIVLSPAALASVFWVQAELPAPVVEDFEGFTVDWVVGAQYIDPVPIAGGRGIMSGAFAGQTTQSPVGPYEVLLGSPSSPLTTIGQGQNKNLFLWDYADADSDPSQNAVSGLYRDPGGDCVANEDCDTAGSVAFLFDFDLMAFGMDVIAVNAQGSSLFASFYRRDGSLIGSLTILNVLEMSYSFMSSVPFAGITFENDDPAGLAYDNLRTIPEPATVTLFALGMLLVGAKSKNRRGTLR
jgi:hypothetical protein